VGLRVRFLTGYLVGVVDGGGSDVVVGGTVRGKGAVDRGRVARACDVSSSSERS
jgi:hypothetical protein